MEIREGKHERLRMKIDGIQNGWWRIIEGSCRWSWQLAPIPSYTESYKGIVPALFLREESMRKGTSIEWLTMVRWPEHDDDDDEVSIPGERAHQGPFFGSMRTHRAIGSLGVPFGHQRRAAVSGYLRSTSGHRGEYEKGMIKRKRKGEAQIKREWSRGAN